MLTGHAPYGREYTELAVDVVYRAYNLPMRPIVVTSGPRLAMLVLYHLRPDVCLNFKRMVSRRPKTRISREVSRALLPLRGAFGPQIMTIGEDSGRSPSIWAIGYLPRRGLPPYTELDLAYKIKEGESVLARVDDPIGYTVMLSRRIYGRCVTPAVAFDAITADPSGVPDIAWACGYLGMFTMCVIADSVAVLCQPPRRLEIRRVNGELMLHNLDGHAVEWGDGTKLSFVAGEYVPYDMDDLEGKDLSFLSKRAKIEIYRHWARKGRLGVWTKDLKSRLADAAKIAGIPDYLRFIDE